MMMGLVPVRNTVQLSHHETSKESVQVLLDVLRGVRGSKLGKTGGPAGCDRCQAVGG